MNTLPYIVNSPLPILQDFKSLKKEALDYIQGHIGSEWTNFNPSDPGVTILDQLCFALTELGYCTSFSIPDILTDAKGKIEIENQFYLPNEILTTAPFTINDYKKYLIDGVKGIENVCIIPCRNTITPLNRVYQIYLQIDPKIALNEYDNIYKSAFFCLNKSRNIGELFNEPIALQPENCLIGGKILLKKEADPHTVLQELQNKIRNCIFPKVVQTSYGELLANGYTTAEIFDGPYLKNGGIITASLNNKKDKIRTVDLIPIIESVSGVLSVSGLLLYQNEKIVSVLESNPNQVLSINFMDSYQKKQLILLCEGKELPFDASKMLHSTTINFADQETKIMYGKNDSKTVPLPKSTFRDINTYYSIQNTFPSIFGVGKDSTAVGSSPIQIAQSRQLKGYLTLFDQILANQFSQLANISKLFSFKNAVSGDPSDEETFYAVKNKFEQKHLEYPVPYKIFAPSYFYQSLYTTPHIKDLLKNNNTFNFGTALQSEHELEEQSWIAYQQDPYNPYIFGLMKLMEDDAVNFQRRNKLLDHLLARHGESPLVIDSIIAGTIYTGDKGKDQLIVKSVYLQNLGLLSYNRQKSYNYIGAVRIADTIDGKIDTNLPVVTEEHIRILNINSTDFIIKSEQINRIEKLTKQDFNNFSGLELKLNLLFGLRNQYLNFIASRFDDQKNSEEDSISEINKQLQQALWLTEKRRGIMVIETALLLKELYFDIIIQTDAEKDTAFYSIENINYESAINLNSFINTLDQVALDQYLQEGLVVTATKNYTCKKTNTPIKNQEGFKKINTTDCALRINLTVGNENIKLDSQIFKKDLLFVFPSFIPQFRTSDFKKRLKLFLKNNLSVSLTYECLFLDSSQLEVIIPDFINWYESLRFKNESYTFQSWLKDTPSENPNSALAIDPAHYTMNITSSLTSILEKQNGRNK